MVGQLILYIRPTCLLSADCSLVGATHEVLFAVVLDALSAVDVVACTLKKLRTFL